MCTLYVYLLFIYIFYLGFCLFIMMSHSEIVIFYGMPVYHLLGTVSSSLKEKQNFVYYVSFVTVKFSTEGHSPTALHSLKISAFGKNKDAYSISQWLLLHVIGDKNIDEEGSVELEQTRARLLECQNELDRLKETLQQKDRNVDQLRQVSLIDLVGRCCCSCRPRGSSLGPPSRLIWFLKAKSIECLVICMIGEGRRKGRRG